ncbi:helix-turn-helix domain-containing protein [Streptomyces sp. ME19-01-6]|uniref:helix-turn-helix domain-containing protein n=1 Tax=Streptomyces sp. ME19-01-6 TaxID=3028686 RepID=UPI0029AA2637|nr:helix-turn-helix domain-containing protein [Streptomyces sp. ME19-01-6]MDX3227405.1 helix-turn-helix domain-containing protein [Streptomyces sp. ME19-01-6]
MGERNAGDVRTADGAAEIGRRVLRLRTERGLTQRQLAEPAYTAAYVSTLESGKARPSEAALRHLAERLGISYEELTTGRDPHDAIRLRAGLTDARRELAAGDAKDAAALFEELMAEAERLGFRDERATALVGLGDCAQEVGELAAARAHYEAAEELLADEPLPRRVPAIRGRAVAHFLSGELRYSCYLLESAIDELNASGLHDPNALLLLYTASIAPYMDMGAHGRAARSAELALALAPSVDDPGLIARLHRGVARTLIAEGRTAEADASLAKAQELYEQLRIHTDLAHCHWMRGYVHAQDGNLERAERELCIARDMLASKRAALYVVQVEVELADVLRRRGRTAEAEALLLPLLKRSTGDGGADADQAGGGVAASGLTAEAGAVHAGGAHRLLGLIAEERGEAATAEEHYRASLSLLERTGAAGDLADLCRLLGDLLRRAGRTEAAMDAYRRGLGHRAAPGTTTLGPAPAEPPV